MMMQAGAEGVEARSCLGTGRDVGRQVWSGAKGGFSKGISIRRGGQSLLLASEMEFANILELVVSRFSYDQTRENMGKKWNVMIQE